MENFQEVLDQIEVEVEGLRNSALKIKEEQFNTLKTLKAISQSSKENEELSEVEKEEIVATVERLHIRLSNLDIKLNVSRNETQVEALQKVNEKIECLVELVQCNSPEAENIAKSYLNSCSNGTGSRFEALLLSCTSEDQKAVKEQIQTIVDNMKALEEPNCDDADLAVTVSNGQDANV